MQGTYFGPYPWRDWGILTAHDLNAAIQGVLQNQLPPNITPGYITNDMLAYPWIVIGSTKIELGETDVNIISGLADPINPQDSCTKHYTDYWINYVENLPITIGTTQIHLGQTVPTLTGIPSPVMPTDVTNKDYTDSADSAIRTDLGTRIDNIVSTGITIGSTQIPLGTVVATLAGIADPVNVQDVTNKRYVDLAVNSAISQVSSYWVQIGRTQIKLNTAVTQVTGLDQPVNPTDICTKAYADQIVISGGGIPDAPFTGRTYGRQNGNWIDIFGTGGTFTGNVTINPGNLTVTSGNLTVGGNETVNGVMTVAGGPLIVQALGVQVTGNSTFNGNVTITGNINMQGSEIITGGVTSTGPNAGFTFAERDASATNWVWYANAGNAYLMGGTTNRITVDGSGNTIQTGNDTIGGNYRYFANGTGTSGAAGGPFIFADATNMAFHTGSGNGNFAFQSSAGTQIAYIDNGGSFHGNSAIFTSATLGSMTVGAVHSTSNIAADGQVTAGSYLYCGGLAWQNYSGYMYTGSALRTGSSLYASGQIHSDAGMDCGGTMSAGGFSTGGNGSANAWYANYINSYGDVRANGNLSAGNDVNFGGYARGQGLAGGPAGAGNLQLWNSGSHVCFRWDGNLHYRIDEYYDRTIIYSGPGGLTIDGGFSVGNEPGTATGWSLVAMASGTIFECFCDAVSDARLKENVRDTSVDALKALCAIPVRAFEWNDEGRKLMPNIAPEVPIGLVAQEVQEQMPYVVGARSVDGMHRIIDDNMTPYLIRAIQQLEARVKELESH